MIKILAIVLMLSGCLEKDVKFTQANLIGTWVGTENSVTASLTLKDKGIAIIEVIDVKTPNKVQHSKGLWRVKNDYLDLNFQGSVLSSKIVNVTDSKLIILGEDGSEFEYDRVLRLENSLNRSTLAPN